MPIPLLAGLGARFAAKFASSKALTSTLTPRGPNMHLPGGGHGAGGNSPLDMFGNVANIGGTGLQIYEMFGGGNNKTHVPDGPKTKYESVL